MNREELEILLKENPTIKILRAQNASLILPFLWQMFKKTQRISISSEELIISLGAFLEMENYRNEQENTDYLDIAEQMISLWCKEDHRYLRKYVNEKGIIVHELTNYTERVYRWLDDLKPKETIATESRFFDILRRLEELVLKSMENPEEKIRELKKKKKEIDLEIREIEKSGMVKSFTRWQIKERFEEISSNSRDLLADFKDVEQNFKKIVDSIYKEEAENSRSRGDILGFALDAHQELKDSPQGKTFHSFWKFLVADSGKDSISSLVQSVYEILEEKSLSHEDDFLKNLKRYLHRAGKKIIDSNHQLGKKINRLLSENNILQRRRIKELIGEIKQLVFMVKDDPPEDSFFSIISGEAEINMPMERPLRFPEEKQDYQEVDIGKEVFDYKKMSTLFKHFYIDRKKLESNIRRLLKDKQEISLNEVLNIYPLVKGLSEIIAYFEIASSSYKNRIIEESAVVIDYIFNGKHKQIEVPEVIFSR